MLRNTCSFFFFSFFIPLNIMKELKKLRGGQFRYQREVRDGSSVPAAAFSCSHSQNRWAQAELLTLCAQLPALGSSNTSTCTRYNPGPLYNRSFQFLFASWFWVSNDFCLVFPSQWSAHLFLWLPDELPLTLYFRSKITTTAHVMLPDFLWSPKTNE